MPQPAGFWRRFAAQLIDAVVIFVVLLLPFYLFYGSFHAMNLHPVYHIITMPAAIAYYVFFLSSRYRATPGKQLMRVYIVTAAGHTQLRPLRAFARYLAYSGPSLFIVFVPFFFAPPEISYPSAEDKQHMAAVHYYLQQSLPVSAADRRFMDDFRKKQQENAKTTLSSPFFLWVSVLGVISFIYALILASTVAFTREKTGIHDMFCETRALVGRPEGMQALA